jgi:hypothetical protein
METLPAIGAGDDWTDEEISLIVNDYFDMFRMSLADQPFSKTERRRSLMPKLNGRSHSSLEFKHRNISTVMDMLGFQYLPGYVPAENKQNRIIPFVQAYLAAAPDLREQLRVGYPSIHAVEGDSIIEYEKMLPPPSKSQKASPIVGEREHPYGRVAKVDWAAIAELNSAIGKKGEQIALGYEKCRLQNEGRMDLADQVVWASKEEGDGLGYDIRSFEVDGSVLFIEVKTTVGGRNSPIYFSENERLFAQSNRKAFRLYRIYQVNKDPKLLIRKGAYEDFLGEETPTLYQGRLLFE